MAKRVLAKTRSTISSAQSWYRVCNVSRQPARSPRRNQVSYPAEFFSYSAWKDFRRISPCATSLLIVSAFCIRGIVLSLIRSIKVVDAKRSELQMADLVSGNLKEEKDAHSV